MARVAWMIEDASAVILSVDLAGDIAPVGLLAPDAVLVAGFLLGFVGVLGAGLAGRLGDGAGVGNRFHRADGAEAGFLGVAENDRAGGRRKDTGEVDASCAVRIRDKLPRAFLCHH